MLGSAMQCNAVQRIAMQCNAMQIKASEPLLQMYRIYCHFLIKSFTSITSPYLCMWTLSIQQCYRILINTDNTRSRGKEHTCTCHFNV